MDKISETAYQGCIQIYGLLFWLFSVLINHWKLKKEEPINIDYNFLLDSDERSMNGSLSDKSVQYKSERRSSSAESSVEVLPPKPKYPPPTVTLKKHSEKNGAKSKKSPLRQSDKKCTKQSLSLKSHMLSWKQKLSNSQPSSPVDPVPIKSFSSSLPNKVSPSIPKRSFLRRLSSANTGVYSDTESISVGASGSKSESSSPTTSSKLKSFSFKLKKQDSVMMTDDNSSSFAIDYNDNSRSRRLSLTNFRRKIYPDITIK